MSPVITRPRPARARHLRGTAGVVCLVAAAIATEAFAIRMTLSPSFVDRVVVENPGLHNLEVDVGDADGDRWLGLGTVSREDSRSFRSVIDQGDVWLFRFQYAGVAGGEVVVDRGDLEADRWRVRVPDGIAARLTDAGFGPSARSPGEAG